MLRMKHAAVWLAILKETAAEWWEGKEARLGAPLAYYTILSLAPMLLLITPAVGLVVGQAQARRQLINQFSQLLGAQAAAAGGALVGGGPPPAREVAGA